jgi:hypothetical protein
VVQGLGFEARTDEDQLLLLDGGEAGEGPDAVGRGEAEAQSLVDPAEVGEVVRVVLGGVGEGGPAQAFHFRVV